jgi:hypothetical protein
VIPRKKRLVVGGMEAVIEDIKARRYDTKEYVLDDGANVKAVECIPSSGVTENERKKVVALDDLSV